MVTAKVPDSGMNGFISKPVVIDTLMGELAGIIVK